MQLSHILHFFCLLLNPRRKNTEESNLEDKGVREWVLHFLSSDQETPCPERYKHNDRREVVHHLTGKLLPLGFDE